MPTWLLVKNCYIRQATIFRRVLRQRSTKFVKFLSLTWRRRFILTGLNFFIQAACIIVVCSPGYRRCVESNDCTTSCDVHWQYTVFLYKLMFAEYKELNCKNRRFRPVVFKGSSDADVPSFLKNTLIYKWPEQHESLMDFLFGDGQMNA